MTSVPLDPHGEASRALATAIEDFGPRALSNAVVLANLFKDLLPDSPRETTVLVAVAEAGLAKAITDRIDQGLPPDSATYQAATIVAEARAMDPAAVRWAARQFAQALGYEVAASPDERPTDTSDVPAGWPPAQPGLPGWESAVEGLGASGLAVPGPAPTAPTTGGTASPWANPASAPNLGWPAAADRPAATTAQGFAPGGAAPAPTGFPPSSGPAGQGTPGAPAVLGWGNTTDPSAPNSLPPPGYPPTTPPGHPGAPSAASGYGDPTPPPWSPGQAAPSPSGGWSPQQPKTSGRSRTPLYLAAAAVVAVIAAIVVVVAVSGGGSNHSSTTTAAAGTAPGAGTGTTVTTEGLGTSTTDSVPSATTAPASTIASGLSAAETKLAALLPPDLDAQDNCSTEDSPPDGLTNLAAALGCGAPTGLPGGSVFAYQFNSPAAFQAGFTQYNKDKAFDPSSAGSACPPAASEDNGVTSWSNSTKTLSGSLECLTLEESTTSSVTMPAYIWTITQDNAVVEALASSSATFAQLNTWFHSSGTPQ